MTTIVDFRQEFRSYTSPRDYAMIFHFKGGAGLVELYADDRVCLSDFYDADQRHDFEAAVRRAEMYVREAAAEAVR